MSVKIKLIGSDGQVKMEHDYSQPIRRKMKEEIISVLKGAGIAVAGAALTYLTQYASGIGFGIYTPIIVAALSVLSNVVRKLAGG